MKRQTQFLLIPHCSSLIVLSCGIIILSSSNDPSRIDEGGSDDKIIKGSGKLDVGNWRINS